MNAQGSLFMSVASYKLLPFSNYVHQYDRS